MEIRGYYETVLTDCVNSEVDWIEIEYSKDIKLLISIEDNLVKTGAKSYHNQPKFSVALAPPEGVECKWHEID